MTDHRTQDAISEVKRMVIKLTERVEDLERRAAEIDAAEAKKVTIEWVPATPPSVTREELGRSIARTMRGLCDCGATFGVNHDCPILPAMSGEDMHETTEEGDGNGEG